MRYHTVELAAYEGGTEVVVHDCVALHHIWSLTLLASPTFLTSVSPTSTMRTLGASFVQVTFNPTSSTFVLPGWTLVPSGPDCTRAVGGA